MTRRPNARGRRTTAAVEEAALALADELPLERITVAMICERAGISERVFFNHFAVREDAFLGHDRPRVDDAWAQRYVSDPGIPLITGAVRLVALPAGDAAIARRRAELTAAHPALLARVYETLMPVREECARIVSDALAIRKPRLTDGARDAAANVIVGAAAELLRAGDAARGAAVVALAEIGTALW